MDENDDAFPSLFKETQTVNKLSFELYKVPDQLDYVCDLANQLIFTKEPSKVLKESYSPELINHIDAESMREYAAQMSLSKAKILLCAKDLFNAAEGSKDTWFKTVYKVVEKPS